MVLRSRSLSSDLLSAMTRKEFGEEEQKDVMVSKKIRTSSEGSEGSEGSTTCVSSCISSRSASEDNIGTTSSSSESFLDRLSGDPCIQTPTSPIPPQPIHQSPTYWQYYCGVSKQGRQTDTTSAPRKVKKNQDALVMMEHKDTNSLIVVAMDGHGTQGEVISQYFKKKLELELVESPSFTINLRAAIEETIMSIEKELLSNENVETKMSGTTLTIAVIRGSSILIGNIGDSRIVLGTRDSVSGHVNPVRLSIDHKPDLPSEQKRIDENGGMVCAIQYDDGELGPARVWIKNMLTPGLAMSRSLCDRVGHMAGVISTPEFFEHSIDPDLDQFLIIATDGLWEFMSDEECVSIVNKSIKSPSAAIEELITKSDEKWLSRETVIDDTTISLVLLNPAVATSQSSSG